MLTEAVEVGESAAQLGERGTAAKGTKSICDTWYIGKLPTGLVSSGEQVEYNEWSAFGFGLIRLCDFRGDKYLDLLRNKFLHLEGAVGEAEIGYSPLGANDHGQKTESRTE